MCNVFHNLLVRFLYWTEQSDPTRIVRSELDGKHATIFLPLDMRGPVHLYIDYTTNHLYWVDTKLSFIYRLPLDVNAVNRSSAVQVDFALAIVVVIVEWVWMMYIEYM